MAVLLVSFVVDGSGGPRSWSEPNRPNRRSTVIRLTTNFHLFASCYREVCWVCSRNKNFGNEVDSG